ncbi:GNAT family N-acetyltransferase [Dyella psychrodurans]|uniref:GNAT family N-acetyltransferase n=1 Tax=Dyella psychrodurans TaxID=1927960 RepID=A0A370X6W4_9GAMM|nr:GNAT family N-acetyltransferase [Dyella psychrodurans]RDS84108.1 GNAT family N-acetyltransferase [Dyella psychrodurans]
MTIRLLSGKDALAYQTLRLLALKENPAAFSASYEDEVNRSLDDVAARISPAADGSVFMLGAFDADNMAGFVAVIHPQRAKLRHCTEVAGMFVAPMYRRRGYGQALLQAAIDRARSIAGVRQVKLGVNATNTAAKALYESAGFERFGIEPDALCVNGKFFGEEHYLLRLTPADSGSITAGD